MKTLENFKAFILRGNVLDLAIGVMVGTAFTAVVNALVKDIMTPFIGAIIKTPDFSELKFTINGSEFLYGDFINVLITFLIVAATVYFAVVLPMNKFMERMRGPTNPDKKKCPECKSDIPADATRCAFCTSQIA